MPRDLTPQIDLHILSYNRGDYLAEAIESVQRQTFGNFRLTILDDGSEDDSPEIAERYAATDERITVIRGEHRGIVPSRAIAVQGDAPYLGWVDSDDLLEQTALEETWKYLKTNPSVGMVYTDFVDIKSDGTIIGVSPRCAIPYSPMRLLIDFMTFHFRLIRRDVFDRAGGINDGTSIADDYDMCLRISEVTEIGHLRRPLYRYRHHEHNISFESRIRQIESSIDAVRNAIERRGIGDDILFVPDIRSKFSLRPKTRAGAEQLQRDLGPPPSRTRPH